MGPVDVQVDCQLQLLDLGAFGLVESQGSDDVRIRGGVRIRNRNCKHIIIPVCCRDDCPHRVGHLFLGYSDAFDQFVPLFPLGLDLQAVH